VHNLSKTIALMGLLTPMGVSALGIGDIRLHSALNQSLSAEVPLVLSGGESLDDIKVSLAAPEAFAKAGVERHYFLTRLQFSAARASNGNYVIRISSRDVMREPFLNFLVEVNWPQGRMLREFTVLLDPPATLPEETVAETMAPAVERIAEIRRSDDARSVRRPVSRPAASVRRPAAPPPSEDQLTSATYGPVRRDENLWGIAKTIERDPSVTHEQMVVALYRANPQAFRGNINSLKAGATLRIPQHKFIVQLSPQQARNEFAREQGLNVGRLAGRGTEPLAAAEQETPQSQLKLLAPTETKSKGQNAVSGNQTGGKGKDGADLKRELDDTLKQENEEFRSRMAQLEQRLADMQRMLTLKDEYIASLQAQQQANAQKPAVTPPKAGTQTAPSVAQQPAPKQAPAVVNPAATQQPAAKPEPAAAQQTAAKPEPSAPPQSAVKPESAAQQPAAAKPEQPSAVQQPAAKPESSSAQQPAAKPDLSAGKPSAAPQPTPGEPAIAQQPAAKPGSPEVKPQSPQSIPGAAAQESGQTSTQPAIAKPTGAAAPTAQPQPQATPSQQAAKPAPAKPARPKPATPPPAAEDSGFPIEPTYLIAGGGSAALLGLAAWLIARRRKAMIAATESILLAAERESRQKLQVVNPSMTMDSPPEPMGAVKSSFLSEFTPSDFDALGTETDEVDPISEADVYLAYGRHKQAEELIRHAILQHPEHDEFKLKLLEIYFSTENRSSFERYAQELKAANKDAQKGFWAKVEEMGRELLPNSTLFQSPARRQKSSKQSFDSSKALASLDLSDDLIDDLRRFDLEFVESSSSDGEFELVGLSTPSGKDEYIPLASDAGISAEAPVSAENTEEVDSYASLDFKSAPLNLDQADDAEAATGAQSQSEDSGEAENLIAFDLGKMAAQPQTGVASPEQPDLIDSSTADGGEEDEYLMLGSDTENAKEADSHALEFDLVSLSLEKAEAEEETQPQEQEGSEDVGNLIAFDLGKTAARPQADAAIQERPDKTIDDILLELAGLEHERDKPGAKPDATPALLDRAPDAAGFELNLLESDDHGAAEEERQASMPVVAFEDGEDLFADLTDDTDADQFDTKLDLAKAYADMEDEDSARDILQEVAAKGNERQKAEANRLLEGMDQSNLRPRLSLVEPRSGRM
jgi:FimV-like protein